MSVLTITRAAGRVSISCKCGNASVEIGDDVGECWAFLLAAFVLGAVLGAVVGAVL